MNRVGVYYCLIAYLIWGFVPIYWKLIPDVPAIKILGHRIVWALVFYQIILSIKNRNQKSNNWFHFRLPQKVGMWKMLVAALLLAANWGLYIWAVHHDYIVETALGYFMSPLINVVFGVLLLGERLTKNRGLAFVVATCGVIYLGFVMGHPPWISLTLAFTFGGYGVIRKISGVGGLEGGRLESLYMIPLAIFILLWPTESSAANYSLQDWLLLIGGGPVTALPLYFFAEAARRLPLNILGFLQFLSPTLQFLTGVFIYREPFSFHKGVGFSVIWLALAIFTIDLRRPKVVVPPIAFK